MNVQRLRARIDHLAAVLHKRSRMPELIAKFKTGDLTPEEEREAELLEPRWPAIKASIVAKWVREYGERAGRRKLERPKQSSAQSRTGSN